MNSETSKKINNYVRSKENLLKNRYISDLRQIARDQGVKAAYKMDKKTLIKELSKKEIEDNRLETMMEGGTKKENIELLHNMTVKELKALCKKLGIKRYSKLKKSQLVLVLSKYLN